MNLDTKISSVLRAPLSAPVHDFHHTLRESTRLNFLPQFSSKRGLVRHSAQKIPTVRDFHQITWSNCIVDKKMAEKYEDFTRKIPRVMTIAGSDSCAGAGIQADLKTCLARGVFCTSVVTAVTAQNSVGVQGVEHISPQFVGQQICSVLGDIGTDVVKTGMLPDATTISVVCSALQEGSYGALVVDPVLISTSGHALAKDSALSALREKLFPLADLVTPNLTEAAKILGWGSERQITNIDEMKAAAREIHALGPKFVLIKGGHLIGSSQSTDLLFDGAEFEEFSAERVQTRNSHGTGCTLASAISAELAKGKDMRSAVKAAKKYITEILSSSSCLLIGRGSQGPMSHLPSLTTWACPDGPRARFQPSDLLLYAVTDPRMNARWHRSMAEAVQEAIAGGATFLQIREKDAATGDFIKAAEEAVKIAKRAGVPIVVNDRVDVALAVDADGVHIGQSDMPVTVARKILGESKIIGVSAKTRAHALKAFEDGADYIGVGGVFPTSTKADNTTIGLEGLRDVCAISALPVVAIGGIKQENVEEVLMSKCGEALSGVAIVSAVFDQPSIQEATISLKRRILSCSSKK